MAQVGTISLDVKKTSEHSQNAILMFFAYLTKWEVNGQNGLGQVSTSMLEDIGMKKYTSQIFRPVRFNGCAERTARSATLKVELWPQRKIAPQGFP